MSLRNVLVASALGVMSLFAGSCSHRTAQRPDPAFAPYVLAFTAGYIPARSPVLVRLAEGITLKDTAEGELNGLFQLDPSVEGSVRWHDARTLAFVPTKRLKAGTTYNVRFRLGQVMNVPDDLGTFRFGFRTFQQHITAEVVDLRPVDAADPAWQQIEWVVTTADDITGLDPEGCFTAEQNGQKLTLRWALGADGHHHRAWVDSVPRGREDREVVLRWNGRPIESEEDGEVRLSLPALDRSSLVLTRTEDEGEQALRLLLSDPIDPEQELEGLVGIAGADQVRVSLDGNALMLHPAERLHGAQQAFVAGGLRFMNGRTLGADLTTTVTFEELRPDLRFVGHGTILPSTKGRLVPFEAVSLSAVRVRVVRIYESNVPQFLQTNRLEGDQELARVGRLVADKILPLRTADAPDPGRWNRYHIDLDELINSEPGAIYRVELGFEQEHSAYPCGEVPALDPEEWMSGRNADEPLDASVFDHPDAYYYHEEGWYYDDYDHAHRDDPCSPSYYGARRTISRNILASDLGLVAKRGDQGALHVVVSDLRSTAALRGVTVDVLDAQLRSLGALTTDGNGMAVLPDAAHKPFLLVAQQGEQRGYLRLDDGSALDISRFEVSGNTLEQGLKGFLFGERGVWRPGDTLHLTFILQDPDHTLPAEHPIVLELSDPRGSTVLRQVRSSGTGDLYGFTCVTSPDAPTGIWTAHINVGGATFHKSLRIETVKPNRMRVALQLGDGPLVPSDLPRNTHLEAVWLHGAPAASAPVVVSLAMSPDRFRPKGYEDFLFDDLGHELRTEETVVFEGRTNAQGQLDLPLDVRAGAGAPSATRLTVLTRVSDPGGDASTDRQEILFHPYAAYVGIKPAPADGAWDTYRTDTTYRFALVSVDANGRPLPRRALRVRLMKMDQDRWWDGEMDGPTSAMSASSLRHISTEEITTDAQGRATFDVRVDRPLWGRFLVRSEELSSGHVAVASVHFDWPGSEGRSRREGDDAATRLVFHTDRERYAPGDEAELLIPSPSKGTALISIENGHRVLRIERVPLDGGELRHHLTITPDMCPTVYAHVSILQPHGDVANDLPIRLYGVIPIHVEDPGSHLEPIISAPAEIRPDKPFTISIREKTGRAMNYTVFLVDEGLLDLTRFATPDPWAHFHAREALGVHTWDLYDEVIGAFGVQAERILALGGSDEGGPVDPSRIGRFKPIVRFQGPARLEKGGKGEHRFTISNYVGSVRVMVVASNGARAYGNAEQAVPVRQPLMVLATLPRVLGPGEEVSLPVTVFAMGKDLRNVTVKLSTSGTLLSIAGEQRVLSFNAPGEQVTFFRLRAKEMLGAAKVTVTVSAGAESASTAIDIGVRPPVQALTVAEDHVLPAGGERNLTPTPIGVVGTNSAALEVTAIPPLGLESRSHELLGYPHGCLEQTVSKAFPQLFLSALTDLSKAGEADAQANVQVAITKLGTFQRPDGSFAYWPGGDYSNEWSNVYAGHFLLEAEGSGFAVPHPMIERWKDGQRRMARTWNPIPGQERTHFIQAYRLWVLAIANAGESGAMNRLRTTVGIDDITRWALACAYTDLGRIDVANDLVKDRSVQVASYAELAGTFGSGARDEAIIALALVAMERKEAAGAVVRRLAQRLGDGQWLSTQSTAFALMAVARYASKNALGDGLNFQVTVGGKTSDVRTGRSIWRMQLPIPDGTATVRLNNQGQAQLFLRTIRTGTPAIGQEPPTHQGLDLRVTYTTLDGRPVDVTALTQGTDLLATTEVTHTGSLDRYENLALTQVLPSGWELRNARMEGLEQSYPDSPFDHQDIRDDRVLTYFSLGRGQKATFHLRLTAAYAGRYYLPGAVCEAMYDRAIQARTPGKYVAVIAPGDGPQASK